jgi:GcrA cell cycle regulator
MDWTTEAIDRLRGLWGEGHSTAEIGRRMGISKNAVVGKAHRLALPARPSPIRREASAPPRPAPARRQTLPPLRVALREPVQILRRPEPPVAAPVAPALVAPARQTVFRTVAKSCCWPIGEPGTKAFRFCSAEAMVGKPYCGEHAALAYVKVRDRREDAA